MSREVPAKVPATSWRLPSAGKTPQMLHVEALGDEGQRLLRMTADVVVAGVVLVPKGSELACVTAPTGGRVGLACDTLRFQEVRFQEGIAAVALPASERLLFTEIVSTIAGSRDGGNTPLETPPNPRGGHELCPQSFKQESTGWRRHL